VLINKTNANIAVDNMEKISQQDGFILTETEDLDFTALRAAVEEINEVTEDIKGFTGDYRWLSNFWPSDVLFEGITFPSTEHAYVYAKLTEEDKTNLSTGDGLQQLLAQSAGQMKRFGKAVQLRKNFDDIKIAVMTEITAAKYSTANPDLVEKLLATGNAYIEETNSWEDTFWGVSMEGVGLNNLGKIIMTRRDVLNA
jgi:ribA/ribD-fused uncharacterized protein